MVLPRGGRLARSRWEVGIVGRVAGEGENIAVIGIDHHHAAAGRVVGIDRRRDL